MTNSVGPPRPGTAGIRDGVSVIIGTTCVPARERCLERALASILSQDVPVEPIVVVNGPWFSRPLFERLSSTPEIHTVYLEQPGLGGALRLGRGLVTQPFFAFLDDDDVYLPGALSTRMAAIQHEAADLLVTDGIQVDGQPCHRDAAFVNADPMRAFLERNWLASCAALYRSSTVPAEYFDSLPAILEWTALAYRLLEDHKKIRYTSDVTYRLYDSPGSASKSFRSETARLERELLQRLFARSGRTDLTALVRTRLRDSAHHESELHFRRGNIAEAWRCHGECLCFNGWVYWPYMLRLAGATLTRIPRLLRSETGKRTPDPAGRAR